jgi:N-acetylglucosaminyldiphosphoundecaprenol N-acetyl-beta-D-mannosaminyltransferase
MAGFISASMDKLKKDFAFAQAPPVAILGVPFDNITIAETIGLIEQMVRSRRPHYIATANVDFLAQAARDVELRRILCDAHLIICDGTPLVWASRLLGNPLPERVAGSDIAPLIMKIAAENGFRPFFLGASEDSALKAIENIKRQYPSISIAGYYSPPFSKLLDMDHEEIRRRILAAEPDILFVGFGCPKQEKWINMHYRSLGVPVSMGVGGTIDFLAGKIPRAPRWMQKSGTEWIFRLLQEPRRLAKRYFNDLWFFGGAIFLQYLRLRVRRKRSHSAIQSPPVRGDLDFNLLEIPSRLDFEAVHRDKELLERAVEGDKPCLVDLSRVEFIDSTGIGFLIRMQKKARLHGQQFLLINPTINVQRALKMMRLSEFFTVVSSLDEARRLLREHSPPALVLKAATPFPEIAWRGELTAANAEEVWMATADHLSARSLAQRAIVIDLSQLTFIDSTGLSVMIRAKKFAARHDFSLLFASPTQNVRNVISLSKLEAYLLAQ